MKLYLKAYAMCRGTFSALPVFWHGWEEKAADKRLLFLPWLGLELGLYWAVSGWLCRLLGLHEALRALVLTLVPLITAGFIHMDGFMDVADALGSWKDTAARRKILKDSHVGSFAVVGICVVLLCRFALTWAMPDSALPALLFIPMVSRCCSALAVTGLKPMQESQYAGKQLKKGHLVYLTVLLLLCLAGAFLCSLTASISCLGCLAGYGLALRRGYRGLAGINGDIAGYSLIWGELAALAAASIAGGLVV